MGVNRYVYAAGDTSWYTTYLERTEKVSKGYNGVSLTNYSGTATCAIAAGSAWEQAGSGFYCTTETAISGSVATGICYIYSTAVTSSASVFWDQTEPVWREDYQGYYWTAASTIRCIGTCWYDGVYGPKAVLVQKDQMISKYASLDVFNSMRSPTNEYGYVFLDGTVTNTTIQPSLPQGAYIRSYSLYAWSAAAHTMTTSWRRKDITGTVLNVTTVADASNSMASVATYFTLTTTVSSYNIVDQSRFTHFLRITTTNLAAGEEAFIMGGNIEYWDLNG